MGLDDDLLWRRRKAAPTEDLQGACGEYRRLGTYFPADAQGYCTVCRRGYGPKAEIAAVRRQFGSLAEGLREHPNAHGDCIRQIERSARPPSKEPYFKDFADKKEWRRLDRRLTELRKRYVKLMADGKVSDHERPPRWTDPDWRLFELGDAEKFFWERYTANAEARLKRQSACHLLAQLSREQPDQFEVVRLRNPQMVAELIEEFGRRFYWS